MVKFTVCIGVVLCLVTKYRFVNDSKTKIGYIPPIYVLAAVSFQENTQQPKSKEIDCFFFNEYAVKQWTSIYVPYREMLSSEFNNCNDQISKAYFNFRVFLCILTNILAHVFWENELELQIGFFFLVGWLVGLFYFYCISWMCVNF